MSTEYTGKSVSYYSVQVAKPINASSQPYTAECIDIIEALGMDYAEGNAFKAIWRKCAARTLGKQKRGYTDGVYDAEKVEFFGGRMVAIEKASAQPESTADGFDEARADAIGQNGNEGEHYLALNNYLFRNCRITPNKNNL
jgi:hypothetical protein